MASYSYNLLDLNIDKLFEDHKIEEIAEINKLLDTEIEKKRIGLHSMVGDRYKDILTASDGIKCMKTISENVVEHIQHILDSCEDLVNFSADSSNKTTTTEEDKEDIEERTLVMQIRLAFFMNEEIWVALDQQDNLKAAQFYLLAQHIHIGLSLFPKEYLDKLQILTEIKNSLLTLKNIIFRRIKEKLQSVEITTEETSSNLNALMLLENQNLQELLKIFIDNRISALNTVMSASHESVRIQVSAMLRCIITTIQLLHDCFISYKDCDKGLIWRQLENIIDDSSPPTLSQITLPSTPLIAYIPDIIKQFRPESKTIITNETKSDATTVLEDWLQVTKLSVEKGLNNSLKLVMNVKGLYIIREEALKIELPEQWDLICTQTKLPENFNAWYYFFQKLISNRAKELISKKNNLILKDLQIDIGNILNNLTKSGNSERDLRWYAWTEENDDVSRLDNHHTGLSMKTLGYSQNIVSLCEKFDNKYFELLVDVSQYLYGIEYESKVNLNFKIKLNDAKLKKKFIDREELENHLRIECVNNSTQVTTFLQDFLKSETSTDLYILKSLLCARFLQAITNLCLNFHKCCLFNGVTDDWENICKPFLNASLQFWENWVIECVQSTDKEISKEILNITPCNMISILSRWDTIEIQEQTEENVFKSEIKVPQKPSLILQNILNKLNDDVSYVLPHTLPKQIHLTYIERNVEKILLNYKKVLVAELNQKQALQFLFDIKFLTTFCIPRENVQLVTISQEICDKFREKIDPFDLDVFYAYLQSNVKRAVIQSQVILGCLLPSSNQLANLGIQEKGREHEKDPNILALSIPTTANWFPLLPVTAPSQKTTITTTSQKEAKSVETKPAKPVAKKSQDSTTSVKSSAAAIFGGLTTDWFS